MYIVHLFEKDDRSSPVDARLLVEGDLTIGRDPASDWVMIDPNREISRRHCILRADGDRLLLHSLGGNGVHDDASGQRFPDAEDVPLSLPQALQVGRYVMVADRAPQAAATGSDGARTLILTPPVGNSIDVPDQWMDGECKGVVPVTAGSMFDAFCEGAGLEPSMFGAEDPAVILRRAGAVYRQMVLGVGDLMAERDKVRGQYRLAHTTIGGANNNPFKWAPTQRLAVDLLLASESSFLSGPDALNASFRDIKKHIVATFRGLQQSLRAAVDRFDPVAIDKATEGRASLLRGKATVQWDEAVQRHAQLASEISGEPGMLDQAFVGAYEQASAELEAGRDDRVA